MTLEIQMAAMVWYHVYFIVVTMFGSRGQWALYPPRALYPTLPYSKPLTFAKAHLWSAWISPIGHDTKNDKEKTVRRAKLKSNTSFAFHSTRVQHTKGIV